MRNVSQSVPVSFILKKDQANHELALSVCFKSAATATTHYGKYEVIFLLSPSINIPAA